LWLGQLGKRVIEFFWTDELLYMCSRVDVIQDCSYIVGNRMINWNVLVRIWKCFKDLMGRQVSSKLADPGGGHSKWNSWQWWWTVSKVNMLLKLATQTPLLMRFLHTQERACKIHYHGAGWTSDTLTVID
jgi:hypothetical protein